MKRLLNIENEYKHLLNEDIKKILKIIPTTKQAVKALRTLLRFFLKSR